MDLYDKDFIPMLLSEVDKPFDDEDFLFEMKFDGTRTLIYVDPENIKITNKRGVFLNNTYPELLSIKKNVKTKCIFDGEIVLMEGGFPSFRKLQERALLKNPAKIKYMVSNHPVTFICFDILYEGKDLTDVPLIERKKILSKYKDTDFFIKTAFFPEEGIILFDSVAQLGLEGIIAKRKDSKYYPDTRTKEWLKIKNWMDQEFFVCGYKIPNNMGSMASLILGEKRNDNAFYYVGRVTIGKNNPEFKKIKELKSLKKNYLKEFLHDDEGYVLLKPKLQCTVEFLQKTKTGKLRQPIYKGLRLD